LAALANGFCDGRGSRRCSRWSSGYCRDGWSLHAPKVAQCNDGIEEYPAMTNGTDADFLQVLLGQIREDPLVNLVVAERRLVFFEA
jgi:hypothetical protein